MYTRPNLRPDNGAPTVVVVGGGSSPPNTEQNSQPPQDDSTQREAQAAQLGAALERERVLSDQVSSQAMRIESLESSNAALQASNQTLTEKVDALLAAVTEPELESGTESVTPEPEPEPTPEPEPERKAGWWDRFCEKVSGM